MKKAAAIPLAGFALLVVFLGVGLTLKPQEIPSPLIDKPAPAFVLSRVDDPAALFQPRDMHGKVWLLNVWASWCAPCRAEHPVLVELAGDKSIPIVGLNYTDQRADSQRWLATQGNPYLLSAFDGDGRAGIEYGVYGVPETFLIDKQGTIRYKHIGPLTQAVVRERLLPLIRELNRG
jgi:cytochrome c biogenesis protein CcmG/thiol:disulfide interchange protein DsbE